MSLEAFDVSENSNLYPRHCKRLSMSLRFEVVRSTGGNTGAVEVEVFSR